MKKVIFLALLFLDINYGFSQPIQYYYDYFSNTAYYDYDQIDSQNTDNLHQDKPKDPKDTKKDSENKEADKKETDKKKDNDDDKKDDKKETDKKEDNGDDKKDDKKDENGDEKKEETPKSAHTFTANVSLVSDYRFRGISQTMRRPAIQGGFDYSHICGLYVGTWASNVDGTTHIYNNTSMEWDFYGGYKGTICPCFIPDVSYNLGFIYYYYPGGKVKNIQNTRYNTAEYYIELTYKWFSLKFWQSITNYFGIDSDNTPFNWSKKISDRTHGSSRGSIYVEANANFDLCEKTFFYPCIEAGKLSLLLHIGHQNVHHYNHLSYTDWRVTLTQEFPWFNIFATYVGTNANPDYYDVADNAFNPRRKHLGAQGVVVGITKTF